jgi:Ca-activated chloride channel homolog
MNFLSPIAFWFAAAIPVVILFYLLKRKRVVHLVSSTLLWQRFLSETQASAPFQKLRHNWLLVLQILLLVLVILALSRPYFAGKTESGRLLVVILDASASMQSTDETPSRFEKARGEALKLVDSLHDTDAMVVLQAAAVTEVKQSPTSAKSALRRAIHEVRVTDSPTHLSEALKLAETLVRNNPKAEIHLFSDGAVPSLDEFENKALPITYHMVGHRGNNLGIVTIDVRPNPENPVQRAVFASVANFSTNAQQTELEFRFNESLLEVKPVRLAPRETVPLVFLADQTMNGVFSLRLSAEDDLAVDNQASIVSLLPQPVKVLLVSAGNRFLEKAIKAVPNAELAVAATLSDNAAGFDLVVLDDVVPSEWPSANLLAIRSANTNWFEFVDRIEAPAIVDIKSTHPLLRFVSFDNVLISESLAVRTPTWGVSLVDAPQNALIVAGEIGRQRIVWVGFDTLHSTWPLRVSFPIFIANAVDWLNPASANASLLTLRAGDPFRLNFATPVASAQITDPSGTTRSWPVNQTRNEIVFGETLRQGVYKMKAGTNDVTFCINLMDASESDSAPKEELKFGRYAQSGTTTLRRANLELWRWIAVAGLAVLLFEWWYYHRRTA